jgi:hypothetical protein
MAAAYINKNSITIVDYLSLLADQDEEVIDLLAKNPRMTGDTTM